MKNLKSSGFTCWLTGLSGAGKSTLGIQITQALARLSLPCEYLDGDVVRTNLSQGLGFSREDRNINIARVGFVCGLLNKHGINTVAALISPYRDAREQLKLQIPNFIEIFVDTPLDVCITRDVKGLYQKALAGEIPEFTGISSPYEPPLNPDIILKTDKETVNECIEKVLNYLKEQGQI